MTNDSEDAGHVWLASRYAWYALFVLLMCYAFAVVDRIALGLLVDPIRRDLGISDTQVALLQGFAFAIFYTLFGLPMGVLVDRWRRVRLLSFSLTLWSAATIFCGIATSFGMIFVGRIFVGAGEASVTPASSSIISDLFPPQKRAKAFGVFMVGGSIGTAMAYMLGSLAISLAPTIRALHPVLSGVRDWQLVFLSIGLPGIVLAILLATTVREPRRHDNVTRADAAAQHVTLGMTLTLLWENRRAYLCLMVGAVLNTLVIAAQIAWLPSLLIRVHGWSATQVGSIVGLVGLPCGVLSALSAGWVTTWLQRRGRPDAAIFTILVASCMWATFGTYTALAPSGTLTLWAFACTALISNWAATSALMGLTQITPNEMRGKVVAIYMMLTGLFAQTLGSLVVGVLNDRVFTDSHGVRSSMALIYLVGGTTAAALLLYGRPAFRDAVLRARAWTEDEKTAAA